MCDTLFANGPVIDLALYEQIDPYDEAELVKGRYYFGWRGTPPDANNNNINITDTGISNGTFFVESL